MILGIYGKSNSGKTTLAVKLIESLKEKDYRVGSLKHIHEPNFTIDTPNTDTWKHTQGGAEIVVGYSEDEAVYFVNKKLKSKEVYNILKRIMDLDILIAEGHWDLDVPMVHLGEGEPKNETDLKYRDNFDEVLQYAIKGIEVEKIEGQLPSLDCEKCGYAICKEMASAIYDKKNTIADCYYFSEMKVSLEVDGNKIPMGRFAKEIMKGTIEGMISSLKEVEPGKDIKIEIKY